MDCTPEGNGSEVNSSLLGIWRNGTNCSYTESETLGRQFHRFYMIGIAGGICSVLSVIFNLFLFSVFIRQPRILHSSLLYPAVLSLMDSFISISYLMMFTLLIWSDYYDSVPMYFAWIHYFRPMLTVSHVTMAASTFILVVWTFERYYNTLGDGKQFEPCTRGTVIITTLVVAVVSRISVLWEIDVQLVPECFNQARYQVMRSKLGANEAYNTFSITFKNIAIIFFPFVSLAFMNYKIIRSIKNTHISMGNGAKSNGFISRWGNHSLNAAKANGVESPIAPSTNVRSGQSARDAVLTTITLVSSYMIGNLLNVCITIWEYVDRKNLYCNYVEFYSNCADLISLFTIIIALLRLPFYMFANRMIRREILRACNCNQATAHVKLQLKREKAPALQRNQDSCTYHAVPTKDKNCLLRKAPNFPQKESCHLGIREGVYSAPPRKHYHATLNGDTEICILDDHELEIPFESSV